MLWANGRGVVCNTITTSLILVSKYVCIGGRGTSSWFNIKISYQYRKSHCGDKTVVRSSYLHNDISYTAKMSFLYWIGGQVTDENDFDDLVDYIYICIICILLYVTDRLEGIFNISSISCFCRDITTVWKVYSLFHIVHRLSHLNLKYHTKMFRIIHTQFIKCSSVSFS